MASVAETAIVRKQCVGKNNNSIPRTKRNLQNHLRDAGLAYISRTGKIIPAKQIVDELCQCPHKCNERVTYPHREHIFNNFYHTLSDVDAQNRYLHTYMDVYARLQQTFNSLPNTQYEKKEERGGGGTEYRSPKRITCKYLIPRLINNKLSKHETMEVCQKAFCSVYVISTKRVRLQREKLIHSLGLNSYHYQRHPKKSKKIRTTNEQLVIMEINRVEQQQHHDDDDDVDNDDDDDYYYEQITIANKMKNNNNNRIKHKWFVDDPLIPLGITVPDGVTIAPVVATPDHDRDIAIVNNFFSNQLWKPEYIGAYS